MLSAGLTGRSRQVAMYNVIYNLLICAVVVPLLYAELYLDVPSMKALISVTGFGLSQQLALVYLIPAVVPVPFMLAGLGISGRVLERLWPVSEIDDLSRTEFIHDHASVDVETSLMLVDLEQKRVFRMLPRYFELVRERKDVGPLRDATKTVLTEVSEFLSDLQGLHPMQGVEDRNTLVNRQKLLAWLANAVAVMSAALIELGNRPTLQQFQENICEGVDSVFLSLDNAMEDDDRQSWDIATRLTGGRGELMRRMRGKYLEADPPLPKLDMINVVLITNAVEEIFFLLSKLGQDFNPYSPEGE